MDGLVSRIEDVEDVIRDMVYIEEPVRPFSCVLGFCIWRDEYQLIFKYWVLFHGLEDHWLITHMYEHISDKRVQCFELEILIEGSNDFHSEMNRLASQLAKWKHSFKILSIHITIINTDWFLFKYGWDLIFYLWNHNFINIEILAL